MKKTYILLFFLTLHHVSCIPIESIKSQVNDGYDGYNSTDIHSTIPKETTMKSDTHSSMPGGHYIEKDRHTLITVEGSISYGILSSTGTTSVSESAQSSEFTETDSMMGEGSPITFERRGWKKRWKKLRKSLKKRGKEIEKAAKPVIVSGIVASALG